MRRIVQYFASRQGNMAVTMAAIAPVLLAIAGIAADTTIMMRTTGSLQNATDAAALATVREASIPNISDAQLESVFKAHFFTNAGVSAKAESDYVINVAKVPGKAAVNVSVEYHWQPMIAQMIDNRITPLKSKATAEMAGQGLTCVIGLLQPAKFDMVRAALHFGDKSRLVADNCAVFSNSADPFGIRVDGTAQITSALTCSAGGVLKLGKARFTPDPLKDCPVIEDPLAKRIAPTFGACTQTGAVVDVPLGITTNIKPGVYCGGLTISGEGTVELDPGIYVIKDGPLLVQGAASVVGKSVGFYLTGAGSVFTFGADTGVDLAAPNSGMMAGLLFFEDRDVPYSFKLNPLTYEADDPNVRIHSISSNRANNLLGTLYLSRSVLKIDANAPVAEKSAYTAIITGRMWLRKGPTLTLNADYTKTTVPVPDGLIGNSPKLVH